MSKETRLLLIETVTHYQSNFEPYRKEIDINIKRGHFDDAAMFQRFAARESANVRAYVRDLLGIEDDEE